MPEDERDERREDGPDPDDIVEAIVQRWEDWKLTRRDKELIWDECLGNYLVHVDLSKYDKWPWRSNVADSFSQETTDTLASGQRNTLFPMNEDFYEIEGLDARGRAGMPIMKAYLDKQLDGMRFIDSLSPHFKQLCCIGNAPLLCSWQVHSTPRRRRREMVDPATGRTSITLVEEKTKTYEGPVISPLDAYDVLFDPTVMSFDQTVILRRIPKMSRAQLFALLPHLAKDEIALSELDKSAYPSEPSDTAKDTRARLFGVQPKITTGQESGRDDAVQDEFEVIYCHGDLEVDGQLLKDQQIIVVNRKVLAEIKRNPFWGGRPIVWGTYEDLWFTPLGKGPLEPVRGTQLLINTFQNQKADVLNLIIMGAWAYVDDGVIDPATLFQRPGVGIEVGDVNNLKSFAPTSNLALAMQEIEMMRQRGERSTGASRMDAGQFEGGRKTAYEVSQVQIGGNARSMDVAKHIANRELEYSLSWCVESIKQFKWDSGEPDNNTLLGEYKVKYMGAQNTAMRQYEIQQFMQWLQISAQNPDASMALKWPGIQKRATQLFNLKAPEELVMNEQEYAAALQQRQQAEQAAEQAKQSGNGMRPGTPNVGMPSNQQFNAMMGGRR